LTQLSQTKVFNQADSIIEGWYWAYESRKLKKGKTLHLNFLGRELALYRGHDGKVRALEAYCPHMGAHLAEGKVEDNELRCFFHHWKFNGQGKLTDIPCQRPLQKKCSLESYPCAEKYGLIWIWTGTEAKSEIPFAPELEGLETEAIFGGKFVKNCHPNVVMINAIDAHHFASVHHLPIDVCFDVVETRANCIQFHNNTRIPKSTLLLKFISKFYSKATTYSMCYWNASTGSVTLGPDFLHFYILFALRPTADGKTEGRTILVTKKRHGIFGWIFNKVVLALTKVVGAYFAHGDTRVFQTMKFSFKNPIKEDESIIKFIQHTEKQVTCDWGFGKKKSTTTKLESRNPELLNC
jgi:phenylpropionate dioxygenase-like ring-hydroxylating dioxygenase large terminal subunit